MNVITKEIADKMDTKGAVFDLDIKKVNLEEGTFEGWASRYGNIDSHSDIMEPGCFAGVKAKDVALFIDHNWNVPGGKYIEFVDDERGLYVKGKLTLAVQAAKERLALMKDGAPMALSIGGYATEYVYERVKQKGKEIDIRRVKKFELYEISLVTFSSNPDTKLTSVKSRPTKIAHEKALRVLGYTAKDAKCATHAAFEALERNAKATTSQDDLIAELVNTQKANTQAFGQIATLIQNIDKELRSNAHHRENKRPA